MVQPLIVCHSCKKINIKFGELNHKAYCQDCYEKLSLSPENLDFIAIDFEIANNKMSSACSLGMAFVKDNQIIDEKYYLIQPPTLEFNHDMVKVHGITVTDVNGASHFNEVWEEIKSHFNSTILVAHNAQFDMSVLHSCLTQYSLNLPEFKYIDSIELSSRVIPGNVRGSLKERAAYFNIELNNHHNAIADARACAEIVISSVAKDNRESLHSFLQRYTDFPIKQFSKINPQTHFRMNKKFNKSTINVSEITPTVETINTKHPFFMKNIVFTGDLNSLERKDAMQKVVNVGGIVKTSVSSKTDFLIVGVQDKLLVGSKGISTKEKKANELIEKGKEIMILKENDFLEILESEFVNN
jgi:DNA polymerase-3 subunit epsilon